MKSNQKKTLNRINNPWTVNEHTGNFTFQLGSLLNTKDYVFDGYINGTPVKKVLDHSYVYEHCTIGYRRGDRAMFGMITGEAILNY